MAKARGPGPTDLTLVDLYQRNRDLGALDALVERYMDRTRSLIFGMVLDENDADDLTQETFLNVVRGISRFDGRSKFSTWLYQIALNTTRGFFRRRQAGHVGGDNVADRASVTAETPERKATANELHNDITGVLDSLSPPLRTAVVLMVIEGLSAKEVADIEGCAPETIRWRVHEARKILKERLAEHLKP
jgi:RNA polymerase sigma-70 factor (ECF subfamily)